MDGAGSASSCGSGWGSSSGSGSRLGSTTSWRPRPRLAPLPLLCRLVFSCSLPGGFHRCRVGHRMEDLPSCPEAAFLAPDCDHNPVHPSRSSSPPPQPCAAASSGHTRGQDLGHHLFSPSHTGVSCHPNYHLRNPPSISAHQYLHRPSAATTWRTSFPT